MSGKLKEVRERITSVNSTQQITKAMKMVSAAKLKKAQDAIVQLRPYANKLDHMLKNIITATEGDANTSFGIERDLENALVVVVTSSRGLCGAFNANIIKEGRAIIETLRETIDAKNITIMCVGKKGYDFFRKNYADHPIVNEYVDLFGDLSFDHVAEVSNEIMDQFSGGKYDKVYTCYSSFKNAGVQLPTTIQYLPVEKVEMDSEEQVARVKADYIFEPNKDTLLDSLIPSILQTSFQKFLLDTRAAEHGARMTAMDKATENANDLIKELKITYNKARQESITKELSEIVGGAAALGN